MLETLIYNLWRFSRISRMSLLAGRDPVEESMRTIIQEIYWSEPLDEAVKTLARYLESMDEDLRELLLSRRRELCQDSSAVIEVLRLEAAAEEADLEVASKLLFAKSLVAAGFLMQCTRKWEKLSPPEKAEILAPLYKAAYGIELSLRDWPERVDERHLDYALDMLEIAMEKAEKKSITRELRAFIEKTARKMLDNS
ncbi:MAG: hypothetical protein LRS43_01065 [Desulfurococcales archaeon]|nr:hypothetical protein [Desulfurococcales archaeon]